MAIDIDSFESGDNLPRIVAISLQQTGHLFNYLAGDLAMRRGDRVLVDSDGGVRVGTVELEPHEPALTLDLSALRTVIRLVAEGRNPKATRNFDLSGEALIFIFHAHVKG